MTGLPALPAGYAVQGLPFVRHGWSVTYCGTLIGSVYRTRDRDYIGYKADGTRLGAAMGLGSLLIAMRAKAEGLE